MINREVSSLYLHYPFCRHLCTYCDFYKTLPGSHFSLEKFLQASWEQTQLLLEELEFSVKPLETLYLGGGTPSLWGSEGAEFLTKLMQSAGLVLAHDHEMTLELNPEDWTADSFQAWQQTGVNRISMGLQALRDDFLTLLERQHSADQALKTLEFLQQQKINYSVDFMIGLPDSEAKKRNVLEELKQVLNYGPSHFSVYILTLPQHHKLTPHLPSDDWIASEYLRVSEFLQSQGFEHYEVSNFALSGLRSQHNSRYWNQTSILSLGPTGTGCLYLGAEKALRYKWKVQSPAFEREDLGPKELLTEQIYLGLRTDQGLEFSKMPFEQPALIETFKRWKGCFELFNNEKMVLNSRGFLFLDSVVSDVLGCL